MIKDVENRIRARWLERRFGSRVLCDNYTSYDLRSKMLANQLKTHAKCIVEMRMLKWMCGNKTIKERIRNERI